MLENAIDSLKADCAAHGRGRKKWWAEQLGVPPLTVSHWMSGRQGLNGPHTVVIQSILAQDERDREAKRWLEALEEVYYRGTLSTARPLLGLAVVKIMSASHLGSRALGFLSFLLEREKLDLEPCADYKLANRLGWLLEVSGRPVSFSVKQKVGVQTLLALPNTLRFRSYLKSQQTAFGKKWMLFDCDLAPIKKSFLSEYPSVKRPGVSKQRKTGIWRNFAASACVFRGSGEIQVEPLHLARRKIDRLSSLR